MDNALWVAVVAALSALAGAGLTLWGTMRTASIQAERTESREARQWERQKADKQAAALRAKGEEFLGWVLLAETRMQDRLEGRCPKLSDDTLPESAANLPAAAARQAYAVALLYLDALRPLAKDFYQATAQLQVAFDGDDATALQQLAATWGKSYSRIEEALAEAGRSSPPM